MKNMLYIVWNDNNNFGIPIIDEQHRRIVATINSLFCSIREGHGFDALKPTMSILTQYTKVHFRTEEALMVKTDYPVLEEHILLHKELAKKTKDIMQESILYKDANIALKFLREWWLGHINKEDRKYTPYFKKLMETR